jgi:hypothetical protein
MFEDIKTGDTVAMVTESGMVRLVKVVHVTRKQIHVMSVSYQGGSIEKYRREDGSQLRSDSYPTSLAPLDDPRVIKRLANDLFRDVVGNMRQFVGQSIKSESRLGAEPSDLVASLNEIKTLIDETISTITDGSKLVEKFQ